MDLTPRQIEILKDTYARILPESERISGEFYADLFRRDPRIRTMFRDDIGSQGMRFMHAIGVIVHNLDDPARLDAEIEKLAAGHAPMGIRPEWYHTMQEALLDAFRYALGARFTDEVHLAWRGAFEQICARMRAKAA